VDVSTVTLITGGSRSGKSRYALEQARGYKRPAFVATAIPFDAELRDRIARHQVERHPRFTTIEAPYDLAAALRSLPDGTDAAVIDCLTVWLGNLVHRYGDAQTDCAELGAFLAAIEAPPCDLWIVTNELGSGIVPDSALSRRFRDVAGRLNQDVARRADRVVLLVCGCPVAVKGTLVP
jgi:adenosylcobinamide kinase/adenosylcobinamide-phosphate guanylyltransferase